MHNDAWPTDVTTPPEKSKNSKQRRYKNFVFIQYSKVIKNLTTYVTLCYRISSPNASPNSLALWLYCVF